MSIDGPSFLFGAFVGVIATLAGLRLLNWFLDRGWGIAPPGHDTSQAQLVEDNPKHGPYVDRP